LQVTPPSRAVPMKFALSSAVAKPVAPFGQGLQTAVAARRVGEGHDGRGVKKANRRQVLLLHLEAPANFSAARMGPEKSQQPRQATFLIGGQAGQGVLDSVVAHF